MGINKLSLIAVFSLSLFIIVPAFAVGTFSGGGQSSEVDAFLTYDNPFERRQQAVSTQFTVDIVYGGTIDCTTFLATLNGSPAPFTCIKGSNESVLLILNQGRNVLLMSVDGEKANGRTANDKDRLTILN